MKINEQTGAIEGNKTWPSNKAALLLLTKLILISEGPLSIGFPHKLLSSTC